MPQQPTVEQRHHWTKTWLADRDRARRDLFWLANNVLSPADSRIMVHHAHDVIVDHCQKFQGWVEIADPMKLSKWGFPLIVKAEPRCKMWDLKGDRDNLLLVSRGHLKTSINTVAHSVQWIINYPDVRILVVTATDEKAQMMVKEIKQHFQFNAIFRFLFPEFCPDSRKVSDWGSQTEFTVPNRHRRSKEPTVMTASVGKALASTHHDVIKASDVVTENNVRTDGQIKEVKDFFGYLEPLRERGESKDGSPNPGWKDVEGTIYHFCLIGESQILMADWTHKPINQVQIGDRVIGWRAKPNGGKRFLEATQVVAIGKHANEKVSRYVLKSGRSVVCTPAHQWWKGKDWNKGSGGEYAPLGLSRNLQRSLRQLLVPSKKVNSWESGWLAGFFDGEGTFRKNPNHPSGNIAIVQTMHNPELIERTRIALRNLGFQWSESWHSPSKKGKKGWQDRCVFNINGGWRERYRFLAEIAPYRNEKIAASLLGNLQTERDDLERVYPEPNQDVYWIQTETGNYIADGYCSKNSDYYQLVLDSESSKPKEKRTWRITKQSCWTDEAKTRPLWPERFPASELHRIENSPEVGPVLFASQYELNPIVASDGLAALDQIKFFPAKIAYELMPRYRVHTTVDLAGMEKESTGDFSVISTCGFDRDGRIDVLSILRGHFTDEEIVDRLFAVQQVYPSNIDFKIQKDHFSATLKGYLHREQAKRGVWLNIIYTPTAARGSKSYRIIKGLQGWFRQGIIRFADDITCKNELILEILRFPKGKHDDILDTLADQFMNRDGDPVGDVYPDGARPVPFGAKVSDNRFLEFDPITKDMRWLHDQIEGAHAEYHQMTGGL